MLVELRGQLDEVRAARRCPRSSDRSRPTAGRAARGRTRGTACARRRRKAASAAPSAPLAKFITLTMSGRTSPSSFSWSRKALIQAPLRLERPREIVAEEQRRRGGRRASAHLPDPHVRVIDRHVVARLEGQPEQAVRRVERRLDDAVELEIRLDLASSRSKRALRSFSA